MLQRLAEDLLDTHIAAITKKVFDAPNKARIEIASERRARVIREDADQHDRIVLADASRAIGLGQELVDLVRSSMGGSRGRLGGLDDGREVQELIALDRIRERPVSKRHRCLQGRNTRIPVCQSGPFRRKHTATSINNASVPLITSFIVAGIYDHILFVLARTTSLTAVASGEFAATEEFGCCLVSV